MTRAGAGPVVVSLLLDAAFAEPPTRIHPVVGMGAVLARAARHVPAGPPGRALAYGGLAVLAGGLGSAAVGAAVSAAAGRCPRAAATVVQGTALWTLLSVRRLLSEVAAVEAGLHRGLDEGRAALRHVVSRDTAPLDATQVRAAAIESLAENLSDSVVAPLWWYAVGGLPAAAAYRFVNTADACWGYRTDRWLHAGRVAARADDLLNLVPARVTAGLLLLGAPPRLWRRLPGQAGRTASPNAGWPMAAMALRLDRQLAKPGAYVLHPAGGPVRPGDLPVAFGLAHRVVAVAAALATGAVWARRGQR